jgi:hypothetical protein
MTDDEINRLVAEKVMGFTKIGEADSSYIPDYCNDLAVLGNLLVWLCNNGKQRPYLYANYAMRWVAGVEGYDECHSGKPGRALALAALRAHEVTP